MPEQPERPRDPEGVGALDDMLSQSRSDEVEMREWYAAQGLPVPDVDQTRPLTRDERAGLGGQDPPEQSPRGYPPTRGYPGEYEDPNRTQQFAGPGYPPYSPPSGGPGGYEPPRGYESPPTSYYPPPPPPPRRGGPSNVVLFAALAVAAVVVLAAIALLALSDSGSGQAASSPASASSSPSATSSGDASGSSSASGDSSSPSDTSALPAGATACSGGSEGGLSAASGNRVTSCGFAVNVRDAYVAANPADGATVKLKVKSPVTKRSYKVTCEGQGPVTCRGGTNAVIYLY